MMVPARLPQGTELSAHDPAFRACPHRLMEQVRQHGPHYPDPVFDRIVLTGLPACRAMLLRPDVSAAPRTGRGYPANAVRGLFEDTILQQDPPEHSQLRPIVNQAFSAAQVRMAKPRAEALAATLLDALDPAQFDARARFAIPLATGTVAGMLGIDPGLHTSLAVWVQDLEAMFDPFAAPEAVARMERAQHELLTYFRARCRAAPDAAPPADVVARLVQANATLGLGLDALAATCVLLVGAAITTTSDLITNGLHLLLAHPAQLAHLRRDPALMSATVEEVLRLEPPVAQYSRFAIHDLVLDGTAVPAGSAMAVSVIAAGSDPAVHPSPQAFDPTSGRHGHLAFAAGLHACPGSLLARMEAAVAWQAIISRFGDLRLAAPPQRRVSLAFNGWERLDLCP